MRFVRIVAERVRKMQNKISDAEPVDHGIPCMCGLCSCKECHVGSTAGHVIVTEPDAQTIWDVAILTPTDGIG